MGWGGWLCGVRAGCGLNVRGLATLTRRLKPWS